jgi:hypothetical protein
LKAFNRKERFFLVGTALGNHEFKLCAEFRELISKALHLDIPENTFTAMDYHLDWVYASLVISRDDNTQIHSNQHQLIHASGEDSDILVAYEIEKRCHIIFLEAKGVKLFSNHQLQSKIQRLSDIFGKEGNNWPCVIPHFVIVSPIEPQRINIDNWPDWALIGNKVKWIPLKINHNLKKIVRCNQNGEPDKKGEYWIVSPGEF